MSETEARFGRSQILDIDEIKAGRYLDKKPLRKVARDAEEVHQARRAMDKAGKDSSELAARERMLNGQVIGAVNLETALDNMDADYLNNLAGRIEELQGRKYKVNEAYKDKGNTDKGIDKYLARVEAKHKSLGDDDLEKYSPDFNSEEEAKYAVGLALMEEAASLKDPDLLQVGEILATSAVVGVMKRTEQLVRYSIGDKDPVAVKRTVANMVAPLRAAIATSQARV